MSTSWCLIESDPGVFTELVQKFGATGISVEELVALDPATLEQYSKVYGLIFLHKWNPQRVHKASPTDSGKAEHVYFAKQVVNDACATLAIVNLLCNHPSAPLGDDISNFLSFTQDLDPFTRGTQVVDYEPFRNAHNSFASPYLLEEAAAPGEEGEAYHFVAYVYRDGSIWELDGLQEGPTALADCSESDYLTTMVGVVERRVQEMTTGDAAGDISFSLMAVVDDPIVQIQKKIEVLRQQEKAAGDLEEMLQELMETRELQRIENQRRRHNYFPMIVQLLKGLAEKGVLSDIMKEGSDKK